MIREKASDSEVLATTLGSDRLEMGLDEDGLVHFADMLSGQYSDEEYAGLREYATNARDSHIEAGQTRPIEVSLPCGAYEMPSEDKPRVVRIRDFGVGLNITEIAEVYSRYGKSTKDHTNEQQGAFGIGGKVGLAPTFGTFKITGVKDGEKAVVVVGRNEAGVPVMDLVYGPVETDECNGVEIELPVHDRYHKFHRKAEKFFQFWPEGSVLVDGKEPDKLKPKVKITEDIWIVEGVSLRGGNNIVLMGDVPYPVELDTKLADDHAVLFRVPIGAVMPTPSRESLRMTPETKDELSRLLAEYDREISEAIQTRVDEAKTKADAVKAALKWRSVFASKNDLDVTWRGQKVPMHFEHPTTQVAGEQKKGICITPHGSSPISKNGRESRIFVGTLVDAVLVHGYTFKLSAAHKKKLEAWAEQNNLSPRHYVLTEKKIAHGWIDSTMRVDWDAVRKIKIDGAGTRSAEGRLRGSYDVFIGGKWRTEVPADQIDATKLVVRVSKDEFVEKNEHGRNRWENRKHNQNMRPRRQAATERYPDAIFVELPGNREAKFIRDFPQSKSLDELFLEMFEEWKATVTKADLVRLKIEESSGRHLLMRMDPNRVQEHAVATAIRQSKRKVNKELSDQIGRMRKLVGSWRVDSDKALSVKWTNPLNRYPLATDASPRHLEHIYLYINAAYAAGAVKS